MPQLKKFPAFCFLKSTGLLMGLLLSSACQKGTPLQPLDPNLDETENAMPQGLSKAGALTAEAMGLPNPNQYQVNLKWIDALDGKQAWLIRRRESANQSDEHRVLGTPVPTQMSFVDPDVVAGKQYQYQIGFLRAGKFIVRAATELTIPEDYTVLGAVVGNQITKFNRIFLNKDSKIYSNGESLVIEAQELHSDGGLIATYPENSQAPAGQDGKTPDRILLKVKRAYGVLHFVANGQRGGTGLQGTPGAQGDTGKFGTLAGLATINPRPDGRTDLEIELRAKNAAPDDPRWGSVYKCTTPGQNDGGPGGIGFPGNQGYRGGKGGSSPSALIQIEDPSQFELRASQSPGKGGDGGAGGPGGPGGNGGLGSWDPHHICPKPNNGATGPQGNTGPQGPTGAAGEQFPLCVKLKDRVEGSCAAFN